MTVEKAGFKSSIQNKVVLQINEKVRVDFVLQLGAVTERMEVSASAATLKTDEASLGQVVEQRRLVSSCIS